MKFSTEKTLLYIEPETNGCDEPLIDDLTLRMVHAVRNKKTTGHVTVEGKFIPGLSTKGVHVCTGCNSKKYASSAHDILLPNGLATNTLAVHYVAFHRDSCSNGDLEKISLMERPELVVPPTTEELGESKYFTPSFYAEFGPKPLKK